MFDSRTRAVRRPRSFERLIRRTGSRNVCSPCLRHGFPSLNLEMLIMDDQSNTSRRAPRKFLKPRRLALLASVAGLSMAVLVIGPGGYRPLNLPAWTASAHAAETAQAPAGLCDLVAKVKPAVISVRVKIDDDGGNAMVSERDSDGADPDQSGSPFEQFFSRQFGSGVPDGIPRRHQIIMGEGSGFFISPDG